MWKWTFKLFAPLEIGRITIEMIARHLAGEKVPTDIAVKVGIIDETNALR